MSKTTYLIATGANLRSPAGSPLETLRAAMTLIPSDDSTVVELSQWHSSPAFPAGSGPDYVNGAARIESALPPEAMLARLHDIEARLGRRRDLRWGPRACDLDLIAAGALVSPDAATFRRWMDLAPEDQTRLAPEHLILPHPRSHERAFVLAPLAEVAPDWRHPILGLSVAQMLARLPEEARAEVRPLSS
jgi:2-amino-4-hydroxy-6-hydroxymethyldihydropteridine diphosphokinase